MNAVWRWARQIMVYSAVGGATVVIIASILWLGLAINGIHVSPLLAIGVAAALVLSIVTREQPRPAPPPPPAPPARVPSRAEIEALLVLLREGQISPEQFRRALGDLVPPAVTAVDELPRGPRRSRR